MKKIGVVAVVCLVSLAMSYSVFADTSNITGTFDPQTSMSISLWNTTFAWGNLAVNGNVSASSQINNTGDVVIDTSIYNATYDGDLTLVAEVDLDAQDEFACIFDSADSSWIDMGDGDSPATLDNDLAVSGDSDFTVCLLGPPSYSADHSSQNFNLTVYYVENS